MFWIFSVIIGKAGIVSHGKKKILFGLVHLCE